MSVALENVQALIGVAHGQDVHFALQGNITPLLLYNQRRDEYRVIKIAEQSAGLQPAVDPLKFFSQIISGRLRQADSMLFVTENILDYFSLDRLKNMISGQPTDEGMRELAESLNQNSERDSFSALVIELEKQVTKPRVVATQLEASMAEFDYKTAARQDSMRELIRTEEETGKMLTPSLVPAVKKYFTAISNSFRVYAKKIKSTPLADRPRRSMPGGDSVQAAKQRMEEGVKAQKQRIGKTLERVKRAGRPVNVLTRYGLQKLNLKPRLSKIWQTLQPPFQALKRSYLRLPRTRRLLLVGGILIAVVFSQSVLWLSAKNKATQRLAEFEERISETESLKVEAEASLIYRDEAQARTQLRTALDHLIGITPQNDEEQNRITQLQNEIEEQLKTLQHIVTIQDPALMANFQNLDPQAEVAGFAVRSGPTMITQDENSQALYRADLENRTMTSVSSTATIPSLGSVPNGLNGPRGPPVPVMMV